MLYRVLADAVMLFHFGFTIFVLLGSLLLLRWKRVAWIHAPCALYGASIEIFTWVCPLSPMEWRLRELAGQGGGGGSFIEHYLEGILYPSNLEDIHLILGLIVVVVNVAVYSWVFIYRNRRKTEGVSRPG
jgi:hypothetical protein